VDVLRPMPTLYFPGQKDRGHVHSLAPVSALGVTLREARHLDAVGAAGGTFLLGGGQRVPHGTCSPAPQGCPPPAPPLQPP
jgi:hypothetical protein